MRAILLLLLLLLLLHLAKMIRNAGEFHEVQSISEVHFIPEITGQFDLAKKVLAVLRRISVIRC